MCSRRQAAAVGAPAGRILLILKIRTEGVPAQTCRGAAGEERGRPRREGLGLREVQNGPQLPRDEMNHLTSPKRIACPGHVGVFPATKPGAPGIKVAADRPRGKY